MVKRIIFSFLLVLGLTQFAIAQEQNVSGVITEAETGMPLPGVTVMEKGTSNGTSTDFDGNYAIKVDSGATLVISMIGYATQEIPVTSNKIDVKMETDTEALEEVVITALGMKRETKALGYSVSEVSSEDLNQAGNTQVANALQGKAAGVQINTSGSGVGGSSKITIRGNTSLGGSNEPLWIVDGVPFNDTQTQGADAAGEYGGVDRAGGSFDINPDDIESISVLKGASAAALYGSRAGNGVILVTTKKGSRMNERLGVNYTASTVLSDVSYLLDLQSRYGQGTNGEYDKFGTNAWGPAFDGQVFESWRGEDIAFAPQPDKRESFFETGLTQAHNLSISGGGEKTTGRFSFGYNTTDDVTPKSELDKYNYDLRVSHQLTDNILLDSKISYIYTNGKNRAESGQYGYMSYFNRMPSNIRTVDLKPGYMLEEGTGNHVEYNYNGNPNADYRNPYFINEQRTNEDKRYRAFGFVSAKIDFTDDLSFNAKYALDYYREKIEKSVLYEDKVFANNTPNYEISENFFKESNLEFLLSYNKRFTDDFDLGASFGGNLMQTHNENLQSSSGKINGEGNYYLGVGTNVTSTNDYSQKEIQSLFGLVSLGFKNYLFLDFTARNDWSSTLPNGNNSYFYPSASLSFVLSDAFDIKTQELNFLKLRASWAQVGKDTDPYQLYSTYQIGQGNFGNIYASEDIIRRLAELKPEITSSYEFGIDTKFFSNRLGLDFTYYNTETENQVLEVDVPQSSQYAQQIINAGLIKNEGIEALLYTVPFETDNFRLGIDFNFSKNITTSEELADNVIRYELGSLNNGIAVVADEGEKFGDIIGQTYIRNENGEIVLDESGLPSISGEQTKLGNIQPDFTGSINISASYKQFFLRTLFNMQEGGEIYSFSEAQAVAAGTAKRTLDRAQIENAQQYYSRIAGAGEEFIYDASYMKVGEFSIGYNFKKEFLDRISVQTARLSLIGRNLFYLYKDTPGTTPDGGSYNRTVFGQAIDYSTIPNTRTYGLQLNISL